MPKLPFAEARVGSRRSMAQCSRTLLVIAAVLLSAVLAAPPFAAQTPAAAGYRDFSYGSSANSTPTGEKPESKLWWNDGRWWGILFSTSGNAYRIHRFNVSTQSWTDTGTAVDTRSSTKADALWDAASGHLYVVSHVFTTKGSSASSSQWGRLYRYSYDGASRVYTLDSGFPIAVTRGKEEALTIAKDSIGRLWVTYVESGSVKVNWSDPANDLLWGSPVDLPVASAARNVASDDISAVVAFGGRYVGVMWSNQLTKETYFAARHDDDVPGTWGAVEVVLPGAGCSGACSDDHFNLKTDAAGRVFAATKTSLTSSTSPLAMLAVRSDTTPATWTSYPIGLVRDHHTRPIVLLDEQDNRVYVFATSGESGGAIYMKSSAMDDIAFPPGLGDAFIRSASDARVNNATSTKQNVSAGTGILVAASDQDTNYYLHGFLPLDGGATVPAAPAGVAAQAVSSTRIDLTWTDASNDEESFSVERATGGGAFSVIATTAANATGYSDTTAGPATTYNYRVRASNAAGFSAYSNTATATTPGVVSPSPPAAPADLTAVAVSSTRVDLAWTGASSNVESFSVERSTDGVAFTIIGSTPASATGYSDTTASPSTAYSYRVRAANSAGFSAYSGTATATTPADPGGTPGLPIRSITFESGTLTGADTSADKAAGTVTIESAVPLKGSYSAKVTNASSSYVEASFTAADEVYVSLYLRLDALPSSDARILMLSNAGATVGNITLRTSGRLRLRVDATTVGAESAPLQVGQIYRVGFHQKKGSGGNAVLEGFVAADGQAFGAAFAATTAGTWTTAADRVRAGATNPGVLDMVFDDILLDAAVMR